MSDPRLQKIFRDIWGNKTRTLLVILSIAVGVFAIGTIAGTYAIMSTSMSENFQAVHSAEFKMGSSDTFKERFIEGVRKMKEIERADGRHSIMLRLQVGANEWQELEVFAVDNYEKMQVGQIRPEGGAWPPSESEYEILLERDYIEQIDVNIGDTLLVETGDRTQRQLKMTGIVHDLDPFPSGLSGTVYGYISFNTLEWLGGKSNTYNQLYIVPNNRLNAEYTQYTINLLQDRLEKNGIQVFDIDKTIVPGIDRSQTIIEAVLLILGVLGVLALFLSGFLVTNTILALLTEQTRQIGIMKTMGASAEQLLRMYIMLPLIFGSIALVIAIPLAALSTRVLSGFLLDIVNFNASSYAIPPAVFALEIVVALAVPLLASLYPVIATSQITIREAISMNGLSNNQFGTASFDRLLQRGLNAFSAFSLELMLSLRNTFRRRQRLALTLITLTLGSAIFMGVFTVRSSMLNTLDEASQYWQYDVEVNFQKPYRFERAQREALRIPGVAQVEGWGTYSTRRVRADKSESANIMMMAPPAETNLLKPVVIEGRWLLPEDENQIVIDTEVTRREPDLKVGDQIVLKIKGRERAWEVVGIVKGQLRGPIGYVNYPYFSENIGKFESVTRMVIVGTEHDEAAQSQIGRALEQQFNGAGLHVSELTTVTDLREETAEQFNIFILLLLFMAIMISVVGGLGLMGTMSLNVLERTREIGIMRTFGASKKSILQIFITEGLLIGLLSWLVGSVLALPLSSFLSDAVGYALLQTPLNYTFSVSGVLLWLLIMVILSVLASFWPAWNASRVSIREVLVYE